jgi:hypothetical protein
MGKRLNDWAKSLVPGLLTALVVGMVTLAIWVVEIRATRFTSADGVSMWRAIDSKAPLSGAAPVVTRLTAIEKRLDRIEQRMIGNEP